MTMPGDDSLRLSPQDERLIDELLVDGFDPAQLDAFAWKRDEDRARAEHLLRLLGLLRDYPVEDCDESLVHATLARIDRVKDERVRRFSVEAERTTRSWSLGRLPLPNLITVAAVLLIAASIFWPILTNLHHQGLIQKQQNNLRYVSNGVDLYARDYEGIIPTARAGLDSAFSQAVTEALNLTPIVEQDYLRIRHPDGSISRTPWPDPDLVLFLGDNHPLVNAIRQGRLDRPMRIELSFGTQGRHNLNQDGVLLWLFRAQAPPDRQLWQPRTVQTLQDDIHPESPND